MQSLRPALRNLPLRPRFPTIRHLHHSLPPPPVPPPTATVPDVTTFLTKIGRKCVEHAPKFTTIDRGEEAPECTPWQNLFLATSAQLKKVGIEPPRTRRYILRWRETYRRAQGKVELKEQKRGVKIDGGERRCKMVRAKRYQAERKAAAGV